VGKLLFFSLLESFNALNLPIGTLFPFGAKRKSILAVNEIVNLLHVIFCYLDAFFCEFYVRRPFTQQLVDDALAEFVEAGWQNKLIRKSLERLELKADEVEMTGKSIVSFYNSVLVRWLSRANSGIVAE